MDRGAWRAPVQGVTKSWTERPSLSLSVYHCCARTVVLSIYHCCARTVVRTGLGTTGPKDGQFSLLGSFMKWVLPHSVRNLPPPLNLSLLICKVGVY